MSTENNFIVAEDMTCPVTKKHCDDECCSVGSECNLSPSDAHQPCEQENDEMILATCGICGCDSIHYTQVHELCQKCDNRDCTAEYIASLAPPAASTAADGEASEAERSAYRLILTKVLTERREVEFFEKLFDNGSVTIDAKTGQLVFVTAEQLGTLSPREDAARPDGETAARELAFEKAKGKNILGCFDTAGNRPCFFDHEAIWKDGYDVAARESAAARKEADDLREQVERYEAMVTRAESISSDHWEVMQVAEGSYSALVEGEWIGSYDTALEAFAALQDKENK